MKKRIITYRVHIPTASDPTPPLPTPEPEKTTPMPVVEKPRIVIPPDREVVMTTQETISYPPPTGAAAHVDGKKKRGRPKKIIPGFGKSERRTITLTAPQQQIANCQKRFIFVQAGRRFGKTTYAEEWLIQNAYAIPNSIWWYVAPTFKAAKELMWQPLLRDIPKEDIAKINRTSCDIELRNGAMICIRGSDREDNLRGRRDGINGAAIEEFSFHKTGVWELIIRPQLADRKGKALFIGTPSMKKGPQYRNLAEYAMAGKDPDWAYFHFNIHDNPHIDPSEIEQIKSATTDTAWKQEYLAEFVEEEGPVYYDFNEDAIVCDAATQFPTANKEPCVVGIDWGMHDKTGVAWVHVLPDGRLVVTDSHNQNNWAVAQHARVIHGKNEKHSAPKAYVLDATAFGRRGGTQMTVAMEFNKEGIRVIPADMQLDVSIMVLKRFITGQDGKPWIYIDKSCKDMVQGLKDWKYEEHEPDIASALRFAVYHIYKTRLSTLVNADSLSSKNCKGQIKQETVAKQESVVNRIIRNDKSMNLAWCTDMEWDSDNGCWN